MFAILTRNRVALQIGGIDTHKPAGVPPSCTLYFDVEDVQAMHAAVKDRVAIEWGPEVY